jgi:hypothetical protein
METYCPASAGSRPGTTASTLRAGWAVVRSKKANEPEARPPAAPTWREAIGAPSSRSAAATLTIIPAGAGTGSAAAPASSVRVLEEKPRSPGAV